MPNKMKTLRTAVPYHTRIIYCCTRGYPGLPDTHRLISFQVKNQRHRTIRAPTDETEEWLVIIASSTGLRERDAHRVPKIVTVREHVLGFFTIVSSRTAKDCVLTTVRALFVRITSKHFV